MAITNVYYEYPNAGWWNTKGEVARKMTMEQLAFARKDCFDAARVNSDTEGKYMDELSIYASEMRARNVKENRNES